MIKVNLSPTASLRDVIAISRFLFSVQKLFDSFYIIAFLSNGNKKKVSCNHPAVLKFIEEQDYESIYIFGVKQDTKVLLIEQDVVTESTIKTSNINF